ncbi:MAG: hypothetical protein ACRC33_09910, partial [Gemmataceae bacterium]
PDVLRLMTRTVEVSKLPAGEQWDGEDDIERQIRAQPGEIGRQLLSAVPTWVLYLQGLRSNAAAMRGLIAVERYRLKHGRWPATLDDCVPAFLDAVPTDPIDGKPVRYAKWADGVVVYSVGLNRKDDGGDVGGLGGHSPISDFGYRLWDVAKRRAAP